MKQGRLMPIILSGLLFWGLIGAIPVGAQHPGQGRGSGRMPGKHRWEMHEKNLENLRLLKLLEILELDDDQNLQFIARFSSFRQEAKEINENIHKEIEQLIGFLHDEHPDENQIMQSVERVSDLRIRRAEASRQFHDDVKSILNTMQLGKMTVFEERFERELMDALGRFRDPAAPQSVPDTGP
jgi:hypothetical protein